MKSYLSLIPISAKVRKRQNRMTLLCIIFAVFLATAIFSMADVLAQTQIMHTKDSHGNWHIQLENITEDEAAAIAARSDVAAASWYDVVNMDMSRAYMIDGSPAALCGMEEPFQSDIMHYFPAGASVQGDGVILTPNAKELLNVSVGDSITLNTPAGDYGLNVSGFRSESSRYANSNGGETTALLVKIKQIGVFMNIDTFRAIIAANGDSGDPSYYVQFGERANIRKAISEIKQECGLSDEAVKENSIVMGLMGLANNSIFKNMYPLAVLIFLLILLAGVLMIKGSLNSNIAERSQFFGMMRCIGMSKRQVVRFVRLEALNWCKTAIPAGAILGTIVSWGLCAVLRFVVGGEFSDTPIFGVSAFGLASGVLLGLLTVLVSAQSPAKRAARVSPMAAVCGSTGEVKAVRHGASFHLFKIETSLGVSHAVSDKKNLGLMTGSFALSIVLFLCFSVLVQLLSCLLPSFSSSPNLSYSGGDGGVSNTVAHSLAEELRGMPGVKQVFGRSYLPDIPAALPAAVQQNTVDMLSYDDSELDLLNKDDQLRRGSDLSKIYGDSNFVLAIWDKDLPLAIGDKVELCGAEMEIAGMLKLSPFSNSGRTDGEAILICSAQTFARLTGVSDYAIVDVQLTKDATDADVAAMRSLASGKYDFKDRRDEGDSRTSFAFSVFLYGFLVIIALITVLNIVNSISMGVSTRMKQYGAMRAVGMGGDQLTKMIAAEAATYALLGSGVGCAVGLPLNKLMYDQLITKHFPYYTWSVPVPALLIIFAFVAAATILAVHSPAKRIRNMAVTDIINEL